MQLQSFAYFSWYILLIIISLFLLLAEYWILLLLLLLLFPLNNNNNNKTQFYSLTRNNRDHIRVIMKSWTGLFTFDSISFFFKLAKVRFRLMDYWSVLELVVGYREVTFIIRSLETARHWDAEADADAGQSGVCLRSKRWLSGITTVHCEGCNR